LIWATDWPSNMALSHISTARPSPYLQARNHPHTQHVYIIIPSLFVSSVIPYTQR